MVTDVRHQGRLVLKSAKLVDWHVSYSEREGFGYSDAIGLSVFNGMTGKRLYYGSARTPDIYSIGLDEQGDFLGEARHEFSLAALEGGGTEKARRIAFTHDSMMKITAVEFTYSLHSAIGDETQVHYKLRYLPDDTWGIVEVVR